MTIGSLWPPPKGRMLPVKILHLGWGQPHQLLLDTAGFAPPVVPEHPEVDERGEDEDRARRGQVEPIADVVVRPVPREEAPAKIGD